MTLCGMCGNPFEGSGSCPYCGAFQHAISTGTRKRARVITTLNLEQGKPRVEEALAKLDRELAAARMKGIRLLRVIHGWGSSGIGGAIRSAVHAHLQALVRRRLVRAFIPGDEYAPDSNTGRRLLATYPTLRASLAQDRENPGITFVEVWVK